MIFPTALASAVAVLLASSAVAAPEPTEPSSTTVAAIGSELTTQWDKDTKGGWTDTTIRLMSGNNMNFQVVTPIATGIDGSSLSSYTFKVPEVSPTSAIYFLLFNPTNATDFSLATYSTRFTISGADGTVTDPENAAQPGGEAIPWGVGNLTAAYQITSPSNNTASVSGSSAGSSASQTVAEASSTAAASTSGAASAVESASAAIGSAGASAASSAAAKASSTVAASTGGASSKVGGAGGAVAFVGAAVVAGLMF